MTLPAIAEERGIAPAEWNTLLTVLYPEASPEVAIVAWDYCKARDIDPMLKPMHIITYGGKPQFVPGIGLYRTIAARTGEYMGMDKPEFIMDDNGALLECYVTLYRHVKGHKCAFVGHADFREMGKNTKTWKEMPRHMLAIRAEADALRKAFPEQVGSEPTFEEAITITGEQDTTAEELTTILEVEAEAPKQPDYSTYTAEKWEKFLTGVRQKIGGFEKPQAINNYLNTMIAAQMDFLKSSEFKHIAEQIEEAATIKREALA